MNTMKPKKRIFSRKVAYFLQNNGATLLEVREGEVKELPERQTFLFKNDCCLSEALLNYKKVI